ncbi:MAG: Trk system potassium transporter TrkA, partial [Clostridia bacterium]|nr:Trk system potassium transporter TrkA [Clostridia bacterium]
MNIIIVGCGMVGQTLAGQLAEEGNNITVIDTDPAKIRAISGREDILGIVGNGATHSVQTEAGIDRSDLLIAVTNSDELNLLCCLIAKKAGSCQTIARIQNPQYALEAPYLKDELGLAMVINPEYAAAEEIARVLRFPSAMRIDTFAKGRVELVTFRLPSDSPLVGFSVRDIIPKLRCNVLVCTVERGNEAFITKGDFIFEGGDVISLIATPKHATEFFAKIHYKQHSVKDTIVLGGNAISQNLCELLAKSGIRTKLVEENAALCEELCLRMPETVVLCADTSDQDLLMEEGLSDIGALVALTDKDEENILISLFAKTVGTGKLV